jgi:hypothetical protein
MVNNPIYHAKKKHVDTQFYFVREKLQSKETNIMYCNTCENTANIFAKPLGKITFELFREILGVELNPFSIKGETWK